MAKEPWEQDDDWKPSPEFWQLEVLGSSGYFHLTDTEMKVVLAKLKTAGLGSVITAYDNLGRDIIFAADKFSCACWCTAETRDRIRRAEIARNIEERERVERIGPEDKEW